ncbi:MAG: DUF115 domain-containing protein, partial [Lachnospiraceae bacterium]|nr:DUF115 domain-containing protein [Lachnospiraceae bacterium]
MDYGLYKKITALLNDLQEMILWFRMQNFNRGERLFADWSKRYGEVIGELSAGKDVLNAAADVPSVIDETVILSELQALMQAMEQKDYVLMADLMQMQTVTFLEAVQNILRMLSPGKAGADLSEEELADAMFHMQGASCEMDGIDYRLEPTTSGNLTLSVTDKEGTYYLHSNTYPDKEGNLFSLQYYDLNIPSYAVYGLGLGYHVLALCRMTRGLVPVTVYESDANIIELAHEVTDFGPYEGDVLTIVHDPTLKLFAEAISQNPGLGVQPVIHYPSIRGIRDEGLRNRMMQIFVQDSSIRNQLGEMLANFRYNTMHCAGLVDLLSAKIRGRDVILVGAGPSLDKNVELLRRYIGGNPTDAAKAETEEYPDENRPLVACVGTAFRKLLNMGMKPDYVAFLDASIRIRGQIHSVETETVPALIASTATMKITKDYAGEKYLICQQGFDAAETFAREHGGRTYESGGSVITILLDTMKQLGARRIITIGMDLGYTDMRIHASGAGNSSFLSDTEVLL